MSEELLLKIKDALDITFKDDDYERKIIGIIGDGIPILRSLFGCKEETKIDWCQPGRERMLLKNYCLYELNNVGEKFENAYKHDIMKVRRKYEVEQWRRANLTATQME